MTGSSILSPAGGGNNTMHADVGRHGQRRRNGGRGKRNFGGTGHRTGGKGGSSAADRVYAHLSHVGGTTFNPNIDNSLDSRARSIMADNQFLDRASKLQRRWLAAPKALFVQREPPQRPQQMAHAASAAQLIPGRRNDSTIRASASMSRLHSTESTQAHQPEAPPAITKQTMVPAA